MIRKIRGLRKQPALQRRTLGRSLVEHALNFELPDELERSKPAPPSDAPFMDPHGRAEILAPAQYLYLAHTDFGEDVSLDAVQAVAATNADFS